MWRAIPCFGARLDKCLNSVMRAVCALLQGGKGGMDRVVYFLLPGDGLCVCSASHRLRIDLVVVGGVVKVLGRRNNIYFL